MKKPEGKLQELVSRLRAASGDNLVSVVLYGSAAREDFHEQYSDVNVLVVFRRSGRRAVSAITPVHPLVDARREVHASVMMTEAELRESADVFAIELLDIQHMHKTYLARILSAPSRFP